MYEEKNSFNHNGGGNGTVITAVEEDLTAESQRQIILPDRKWQIRTNRWYGSTDSRQTVPRRIGHDSIELQ